MQEVCRELVRQLVSRIAFARQRKGRSIYNFGKFVNNMINRKFFILQKFIGQHKGGSKNCFSQVKASLGCEWRLRRTQRISSARVAMAAGTRSASLTW
jgi:hypothetical protein